MKGSGRVQEVMVVSNEGGNYQEMESVHTGKGVEKVNYMYVHMECGVSCFSCIFFEE